MDFQATYTHLSADALNNPQETAIWYYYPQLPDEESETQLG